MEPGLDPSRWLCAHGDALYAYARQRLGDAESAEDAVQAALLAALGAADGYRGQSAERTWLTGILRHKIADILRQRYRDERRAEALRRELADPSDGTTGVFSDGRWAERQPAWADLPAGRSGLTGEAERREFQKVLLAAIDNLPQAMRDALVLRELDGLETDAICEVLGVTPTNLWTLIHRAKAKLREELTREWFDADDGDDLRKAARSQGGREDPAPA